MIIKIIGVWIYDLLALLSISIGVTSIGVAIYQHPIPPHTRLYQLILLATIVLYYLFSLVKAGQTLGMKAWQLKLITSTGSLPTIKQIVKQFLLFIPACFCIFLYHKSPLVILSYWTNCHLISIKKPT